MTSLATAETPRRDTAQTRERILDAAEALFAQRGYYGVSLRDITGDAGVPLALASYHFGAKEELFRHVIGRRAAVHVAGIRAALDAAVEAAGDVAPTIESVLHAFIVPVVDRSVRGGPGWKNYIKLLAQVSNAPQHESFIGPVIEHYDTVVREFIEQLRRSLPSISDEDLNWAFFFYQGSIIHMLTEAGMVDRQSDGRCLSANLDHIVRKIVPFFAAGFERLATQQRSRSADF